MSNENKEFTVNGEAYLVRFPVLEDIKESTKEYNRTFAEALESKAILRAKLDDFLESQGLWGAEKQAKFTSLLEEIRHHELVLSKGGIKLKEAKRLALELKDLRKDLSDLIAVRTQLEVNTAEGQADNAKFNYLVSVCVVYKDGRKYFTDLADYLMRANTDVAAEGARLFSRIYYGLNDDQEAKLSENKFLVKYKFADEKLRLINEKGQLVDREGRLIDETGRFINVDGKYVDIGGNLVNEAGEYASEFSPFLDDDDKPVDIDLAILEAVVEKVETIEKKDIVQEIVAV